MNTFYMTLMAGVLISIAGQASAAKLDINPLGESSLPIDRRCEVSVSTPNIDYGTQSRWQLQDSAGGQKVSPGKRSFTLSVVCPYRQVMRVIVRGSKAPDGQLLYGDRGSMSLRVMDAELDGQLAELSAINAEGGLKVQTKDRLYLRPDFGMIATQNGQPVKGKFLTVRLEAEPIMAEKDARISSPLVSEANFSLELIK